VVDRVESILSREEGIHSTNAAVYDVMRDLGNNDASDAGRD